jgi:hypothetical protein
MDLAFINFAADQVSVLPGKGNLQFAAPFTFPTQDLPTRIAAGNFDGDGRPDFAVSNYGADSITVYSNRTVIPPGASPARAPEAGISPGIRRARQERIP